MKKERHNEYEEEKVGLQVGAVDGKWRRLAKAQRGHFFHAGVNPKKVLMEFKISPDAVVPVGTLPPPLPFANPPIPPSSSLATLTRPARVVVVVVGALWRVACARNGAAGGALCARAASRPHRQDVRTPSPCVCKSRGTIDIMLTLNCKTDGGGG